MPHHTIPYTRCVHVNGHDKMTFVVNQQGIDLECYHGNRLLICPDGQHHNEICIGDLQNETLPNLPFIMNVMGHDCLVFLWLPWFPVAMRLVAKVSTHHHQSPGKLITTHPLLVTLASCCHGFGCQGSIMCTNDCLILCWLLWFPVAMELVTKVSTHYYQFPGYHLSPVGYHGFLLPWGWLPRFLLIAISLLVTTCPLLITTSVSCLLTQQIAMAISSYRDSTLIDTLVNLSPSDVLRGLTWIENKFCLVTA